MKKLNKKVIKKVVILENSSGGFQEVELNPNGGNYGKLLRNDFVKKLMTPDQLSKAIIDVSNPTQLKSAMDNEIIEPPYNPDQLALLLTLNATHFRCCETKATDVTAKGYKFLPSDEFITGIKNFTDEEQEEIDRQILIAKKFMRKVDEGLGYASLSKKLGLDFESIGWCGAEVIRNPEGFILDVRHIPAKSLRVARDSINNRTYYMQVVGTEKVTYVPFGSKFIFELSEEENFEEEDFFVDVNKHADRTVDKIILYPARANVDSESKMVEIDMSNDDEDVLPNQFSKKDMEENQYRELSAEEKKLFKESANELLFIVQSHPATEFYGLPAIIPSLASVNGNISIEDYMNQFFENNAIPRYMITLEGVDDIDDNVTSLVTKYFKENIKNAAHSTLLFPVPEGVKIQVVPLETKENEASFQETRIKNRDEILVAHGMTPAQVGIIDVANLGSGSGMSQSENYKDRILGPRQVLFADLFWNRLFGRQGLGLIAVQLSFIAMDIRDENLLRLKHDVMLARGAITINEVRAEQGLEAIAGGDRAFIIVGNQVLFIDTFIEGAVIATNLEEKVTNELKDTLKKIISE